MVALCVSLVLFLCIILLLWRRRRAHDRYAQKLKLKLKAKTALNDWDGMSFASAAHAPAASREEMHRLGPYFSRPASVQDIGASAVEKA